MLFNIYIYIYIYLYEYKFTVENKKAKKDIHQTSKHLMMPGTNLKAIKLWIQDFHGIEKRTQCGSI